MRNHAAVAGGVLVGIATLAMVATGQAQPQSRLFDLVITGCTTNSSQACASTDEWENRWISASSTPNAHTTTSSVQRGSCQRSSEQRRDSAQISERLSAEQTKALVDEVEQVKGYHRDGLDRSHAGDGSGVDSLGWAVMLQHERRRAQEEAAIKRRAHSPARWADASHILSSAFRTAEYDYERSSGSSFAGNASAGRYSAVATSTAARSGIDRSDRRQGGPRQLDDSRLVPPQSEQ